MNGNCKQQTIKMPAQKLLQVIKIAFVIKLYECKTATRKNTVIRISQNKSKKVGIKDHKWNNKLYKTVSISLV